MKNDMLGIWCIYNTNYVKKSWGKIHQEQQQQQSKDLYVEKPYISTTFLWFLDGYLKNLICLKIFTSIWIWDQMD